MSGYLYPATKTDEAKRARAKRLWAVMTDGENQAGRKKRYREIWTAILQSEHVENLPNEQKMKAMPRVRGVGHAARKAGY